jgi:hypothetical protein
VKKGLTDAPEDGQNLMGWKTPTLARVANGWSMNTDTMGVYGNYYLKRAIVAQVGLGANLPEDAIYPLNIGDESGKPLDGANRYTISFEKGATPPVNAFWSITLYDSEGFQVALCSAARVHIRFRVKTAGHSTVSRFSPRAGRGGLSYRTTNQFAA